MSVNKLIENSVESHEGSLPGPNIETNAESRNHDLKSNELQVEQFITCTPQNKTKIVYGNASSSLNNTVREATMTLYNSLNASDHI